MKISKKMDKKKCFPFERWVNINKVDEKVEKVVSLDTSTAVGIGFNKTEYTIT